MLSKEHSRIPLADQETLDLAYKFLANRNDLNKHLKPKAAAIATSPIDVLPQSEPVVMAPPVSVAEPTLPAAPVVPIPAPIQASYSILATDEVFDFNDPPSPPKGLHYIYQQSQIDSPYTQVRKKAEEAGLRLCDNWRDPEYYTPRRLGRMVDAVILRKIQDGQTKVRRSLFKS